MWSTSPSLVGWGVVLRVVIAVLPLALLAVARLIINGVVPVVEQHQLLPAGFWWLVGLEFGIAVAIGLLGRLLAYLDAVLADRYTHSISVRVIEHASQLDLTLYEDPVFYDRLERARVQATDRLVMIQAIGTLIQQAVTTVALSAAILWFAPWLLLLLWVERSRDLLAKLTSLFWATRRISGRHPSIASLIICAY